MLSQQLKRKINKHAYAGQQNSFTHLRAILVLHVRGSFAQATSVAGQEFTTKNTP
jgi:hypothetical protein